MQAGRLNRERRMTGYEKSGGDWKLYCGSYGQDASSSRAGRNGDGKLLRLDRGGKGGNQAVAAKRAGSNLVYSTKIGKDSFAEIARASFAENGISMDYVFETEKAATGAALISVDEVTPRMKLS